MRLLFALAAIVALANCKTTTTKRGLGGPGTPGETPGDATTPPTTPPVKLVRTETTIEFAVDTPALQGPVVLGALITAAEDKKGPAVVVVPGGSDVSKEGTRKGDGVVVYAAPADTGTAWSDALAARGAIVLTYDKRTCGPNDVASCKKNPQNDLDADGPAALSKDVDAACALVKSAPGFDGRLVLWAHGQAAQVALSSSCAQEAKAIVLLSPIPRAIDAVLVGALTDRQKQAEAKAKTSSSPEERAVLLDQASGLKNLAGTKAAGFASMKSGKFAKDARVDGATIGFWLGWMAVTERTAALLEPLKDKVVVVVGSGDLQLSAADRQAAQALPAAKVVVVDADHHLLVHGALDAAVVQQIADAIDVVIGIPVS
ncbi:MAG: alpha/beta fold hydrolase [Deltaproteobacteria bacterium]|nr:alpha/beta fold hydrolase [Deltaproteobacteria bacterium]